MNEINKRNIRPDRKLNLKQMDLLQLTKAAQIFSLFNPDSLAVGEVSQEIASRLDNLRFKKGRFT